MPRDCTSINYPVDCRVALPGVMWRTSSRRAVSVLGKEAQVPPVNPFKSSSLLGSLAHPRWEKGEDCASLLTVDFFRLQVDLLKYRIVRFDREIRHIFSYPKHFLRSCWPWELVHLFMLIVLYDLAYRVAQRSWRPLICPPQSFCEHGSCAADKEK